MIEHGWRKLPNLYLEVPGYDCFVCSPAHTWGFRLEFFEDPERGEVVAPLAGARAEMAGYPGILHGGFQAMLLDEIACWAALFTPPGRLVFTAALEVTFSRPMATLEQALLAGKVLGSPGPKSRLIKAEARIEAGGEVKARGVPVIDVYGTVLRGFSAAQVDQALGR